MIADLSSLLSVSCPGPARRAVTRPSMDHQVLPLRGGPVMTKQTNRLRIGVHGHARAGYEGRHPAECGFFATASRGPIHETRIGFSANQIVACSSANGSPCLGIGKENFLSRILVEVAEALEKSWINTLPLFLKEPHLRPSGEEVQLDKREVGPEVGNPLALKAIEEAI